jgi:hypothetical protein
VEKRGPGRPAKHDQLELLLLMNRLGQHWGDQDTANFLRRLYSEFRSIWEQNFGKGAGRLEAMRRGASRDDLWLWDWFTRIADRGGFTASTIREWRRWFEKQTEWPAIEAAVRSMP